MQYRHMMNIHTDMKQIHFSIQQLRFFVVAAETLSFTKASEILHVSQPSVSSAIYKMENSLRTKLFIRHHAKGLSLTKAGHKLLYRARLFLRLADDIQTDIWDFGEAVEGSLEIGCLISLAPQIIPTMIKDFNVLFPNIDLIIHELDQQCILDNLYSGAIEIALTYDIGVSDELPFLPLTELPLYAIAPIDHPLGKKEVITLENLVDYPYVLLELPISNEYFLGVLNDYKDKLNIVYKTASMEVLKGIVAEGCGVSLLNFPVKNKKSVSGKPFLVIPVKDYKTSLNLGLLEIEQNHKRKILNQFISYCKSRFSNVRNFYLNQN